MHVLLRTCMATLSEKRSTGGPSWDYYVENNPSWKTLNLAIENGVFGVPLLIHDNGVFRTDSTIILNEKDTFKLLDNKYVFIKGVKHAFVEFNNTQGYIPLCKIRKPSKRGLNLESNHEFLVVHCLNRKFHEISLPCTVIARGHSKSTKADNVVKAVVVGGTLKADIALIDNRDQEVFWISHKAEGGAEGFQQYSGISYKSGEYISNHKEIQVFLQSVVDSLQDGILSFSIMSEIQDTKLMGCAIFGPNFGMEFSRDNVNILGQGMPILTRVSKTEYLLTFSNGHVVNGDLDRFCGQYAPILGATQRAERSFVHNGKTHKGVRLGIYPKAMIDKRTKVITLTKEKV